MNNIFQLGFLNIIEITFDINLMKININDIRNNYNKYNMDKNNKILTFFNRKRKKKEKYKKILKTNFNNLIDYNKLNIILIYLSCIYDDGKYKLPFSKKLQNRPAPKEFGTSLNIINFDWVKNDFKIVQVNDPKLDQFIIYISEEFREILDEFIMINNLSIEYIENLMK